MNVNSIARSLSDKRRQAAWSTFIMMSLVLAQHQLLFTNSLVQANRVLVESAPVGNQNQDQTAPQAWTQRDTGLVVQRRSQRSSDMPLFELLTNAARKQEYRKQLNYQLSDLLARAAIDKSLEKALLKALFQQQQQQTAADGVDSRVEIFTNDNGQSINGLAYKQSDLATIAARLAAISDPVYLNANDMGSPELGASDYATSAEAILTNSKRSMLPCNFNAVSCAKNPYRKF